MWGLSLDDLDDTAVLVWPDNVPAVNAFVCMATQWRMGPSDPIGLDYNPLESVLRLSGLPEALWHDAFEGLRVMEAEALMIMGERRNG